MYVMLLYIPLIIPSYFSLCCLLAICVKDINTVQWTGLCVAVGTVLLAVGTVLLAVGTVLLAVTGIYMVCGCWYCSP
jgi:uncharacterized membrane protein